MPTKPKAAPPLDQASLATVMAKAGLALPEIVSSTAPVAGGSRMPYAMFTLIAANSAIYTVEVKRLARGA